MKPKNTGWSFQFANAVFVGGHKDQDYTGGFAVTLSGTRADRYRWSPSRLIEWTDELIELNVYFTNLRWFAMPPCPFGECQASGEYVACTMQVSTLEPEASASFEAAMPCKHRIVPEQLYPMIVLMAPDIFPRKAWMHFCQQDDGGAFIRQTMKGDILLVYQHP